MRLLSASILLLCPFLLNAQFDEMKALGITQVNPSHRFSESIGEVECEVAIWKYNSNQKDSSLAQDPMIKKYNSDGSPSLISFSNGKPRYEFEYDDKLLTKIIQYGPPDNPFIQVFKMTYDELKRIKKYQRISIGYAEEEEVTAWTNYSYIELTDSTDSVLIESKYGTSFLLRKYNASNKLISFSKTNSRGYLLDEGQLSYENDALKEQTVIHHNRSGDLVDQYTYSNGRLDLIITTKEDEITDKETFTYSSDGRILLIEHFRSWRSLNRQFHTYR